MIINYFEVTLIDFMNKKSNSNIAETPKILRLSASKQIGFEAIVDEGRQVSRNYYQADRILFYDGL